MIEKHLALPFSVKVLGVDADVEKVDMTLDGQIVAICRRPGRTYANAGTGGRGMDCRLSPLAPKVLVSEYQYYDFRAVYRPLTRNEMPRYVRSPRDRQLPPRASQPLRMGRPESQSEQAAGEVF